MNLKDHIRTVPDFPKPGTLFYDISTLLMHPPAWRVTFCSSAITLQNRAKLLGLSPVVRVKIGMTEVDAPARVHRWWLWGLIRRRHEVIERHA